MVKALSTRALRRLLFLLVPLLCGGIALLSGMDASWDLRNYHYYNGWALLHGHVGRDLLVAQTPSFYNPLLDLPFAWAAPWIDARLLAFLLGALHGLNFILLTWLGEALLEDWRPQPRLQLAALLAALGCAGAVALSEIGTVFYDTFTSLGLFASILLLVRRWDRLDLRWAGLAGIPIGLAFGLKQTMVPYPVGLCLALLLAGPAPWQRRLKIAFAFGLGVSLGCLATGGFWMLHLYRSYANPLFPYFNQIFHSPWGQSGDYRDVYFQPQGWLRRLFFPIYFSLDSRLASEVEFRDFRLLLLFVMIPLAPLWGIGRRRRTVFLLLALAFAYIVWLKLFAIYRYLVAMEMLAPLVVMLMISLWPARARSLAIGLLVALLVTTTRPAQWIRVPFATRAVMVSVPPLADPDHSLILLAGHEPLSFLIPAFGDGPRFLRIDSTFTNPDQTMVPFNALMKHAIDAHQGPLLALFIPIERHDVVKRLGDDDLHLEEDDCQPVTSKIGAGPYELCPVARS
jgi:hypothetical protein